MNCRKSGIITGLPDAYGRGRIIGDYRRVALYGVERLLEVKRAERAQIDDMWPTDEMIRMREELAEQIRALEDLASMAKLYDFDITKPATNAGKQSNGHILPILAPSRKRTVRRCRSAASRASSTSTSSATCKEGASGRGRRTGTVGPAGAETPHRALSSHPDYDALFSGDPYWATECVGGMDSNGRPLVTKSSYPDAAYADQSRARAGTEHHGPLVEAPARGIQAILHQGQPRYVVAAVRER